MKKIILIMCSILLLCGCSKEENKIILYDSLVKAYQSLYFVDGFGLPVNAEKYIEIEGAKWYQVEDSSFETIKSMKDVVVVFNKQLSESINKTIDTKYKETDGVLYTQSAGGCNLGYFNDEELLENIKKDIKIKKVRNKTISFEYNGSVYEGQLDKDKYIFDKKIFTCK